MNIKRRLYTANYDYLKGNQNQEISSFLKKKQIFKALRRKEIERPIFTTVELADNNFLGCCPENLKIYCFAVKIA